MSVDVIMPQMGESIAEGTIVKWLKKVGDSIKRDEPIFENLLVIISSRFTSFSISEAFAKSFVFK